MGLLRSTFYDVPATPLEDAEIVGRMQAVCDEFEAYGYRRVGAELRHQGVVVNHKKIRRLMREHQLQPHTRTRNRGRKPRRVCRETPRRSQVEAV